VLEQVWRLFVDQAVGVFVARGVVGHGHLPLWHSFSRAQLARVHGDTLRQAECCRDNSTTLRGG